MFSEETVHTPEQTFVILQKNKKKSKHADRLEKHWNQNIVLNY